jgi:uncharacterized protein
MKANILLIIFLVVLTFLLNWGGEASNENHTILTIETRHNIKHKFKVELAITEEEQEKGLMFRTSLAQDAGMLFYMGKERVISMWMRNTMIPLDMLFIDKNGLIIKIEKNTTPYSLNSLSSGNPASAVLELNGGISDRLALEAGDKVYYWPYFK